MKRRRSFWITLICLGGLPCYAVYLYGLYGMAFGSSLSTFPGMNPSYDFFCNVLSVLTLFLPIIIVFFIIMVCGMILGTLEFYHSDKNIKRILFLIISLVPSMGSLLAGVIAASRGGIMLGDISPKLFTGLSAILPLTVWYIGQFWYLHLIPPIIYPLSIRMKI